MHGIDLAVLFARRRWRRLLNLIDRLPSNSQYVQELANDADLMDAVAAAGARKHVEHLSDWSPEVGKLTLLADLVTQLLHATVAAAGGKPGRFKPLPRPMTALEAAKHKRQMREYEELRGLWPANPQPDDAG